jgi:hypothetical protein
VLDRSAAMSAAIPDATIRCVPSSAVEACSPHYGTDFLASRKNAKLL